MVSSTIFWVFGMTWDGTPIDQAIGEHPTH